MSRENVCIKVPKVFDWVTRQVELPLMSFTGGKLDELFDCKGITPSQSLCDFLADHPDFTVSCFLKPESVICQEIKQHNGRHNVTVPLDSDDVTLQKVKVLLKGLVVIHVHDAAGRLICKSDDIPFATAQTFFLCAPEGTDLHCKITYFQCDADIICTDDFEQLDISILLCLDVQMEAIVKLEIEAEHCRPREELPIGDVICPVDHFPPQCPEIFPGEAEHEED